MRQVYLVSVSLLCLIEHAYGHGPEHRHSLTQSVTWNWDPWVCVSLISISSIYIFGLQRLWKKIGFGNTIRKWQTICFAASMIMLLLALLSPIASLSEHLSYVHMIQHMMIMSLAAPLFALSSPTFVALWTLPLHIRQNLSRKTRSLMVWKSKSYLIWQPIFLTLLFATTLWIWHLPVLYEAALGNEYIHYIQHLSFFISACLFWRVLLDPVKRLRMSRGLGILYLFVTSLHATLLGVFMTLSPNIWYRTYVSRTQSFEWSALEDQQMAGLIMWMPACMIYVIATVFLFIAWGRDQRVKGEFG